MPKVTLKGIIKDVTPVETYGENNQGRRQAIILFVPGYVDSFGDKRGRDEEWSIDAYNENIDKHGLGTLKAGSRVEVEIWISSREFDKKDGTGKAYITSCNLRSINVISGPQPASNLDF